MKRKRKHRYHWSFDKMHPVLQGILEFIGGAIILGGFWLLHWLAWLAWPEAFIEESKR